MKKSTFITIILIILLGCNKTTKKDQNVMTITLPKTKLKSMDFYYKYKEQTANELHLNKLENGCELIEIRLWAKIEVESGGLIFIIKNENKSWTCKRYEYHESNLTGKIDTFFIKKVEPKSSWFNFINSIYQADFFGLPSQSDIKGWKINVCDGYTFLVEYATSDQYKFYYYNCPDVYEFNFSECHKMTTILDIFNKEFGLNLGSEGENRYRCIEKK